MVFDFGGDPPPIDQMGDEDRPRMMGTSNEVRSKIDAHLSGIDWSDPTWGIYDGNGFSFEFSMREEEEKDGFMVHVRGGGDAIGALIQFAEPNKWSLLDCSTGEFIDPDDPSPEGWEGFQAFRDKVIDQSNGEKET